MQLNVVSHKLSKFFFSSQYFCKKINISSSSSKQANHNNFPVIIICSSLEFFNKQTKFVVVKNWHVITMSWNVNYFESWKQKKKNCFVSFIKNKKQSNCKSCYEILILFTRVCKQIRKKYIFLLNSIFVWNNSCTYTSALWELLCIINFAISCVLVSSRHA